MERSLRVLDGACAVFCAVGGVEPQSETVWRQADKYGVPRMAFVNKMDRPGADFFRVVEMMKTRLKARPMPIQVPIGAEENFKGVIDLVLMKALTFDEGEEGFKVLYSEIPADLLDTAKEWREKMIEMVSETDDALMDKYLGGVELTEEELRGGIRKGCIALTFTPMMCGSAFKNKGVQPMLDAVVSYMPSPLDIAAIKGVDPDGNEVERKAEDKEPFSALIFKIMADPFVGSLAFIRVYSGVLGAGSGVLNAAIDEAAAEHGLFAEQVSLGLFTERRLDDAGAGIADGFRVGQRNSLRDARGVLVDGDEPRQAAALLVLVAQRVARAFRRGQRHVHVLARLDEAVVDVEAVAEHQVLALAGVRLDLVRVHHGLLFVGREDHHHVSPFGGFGRRDDLEAFLFGLGLRSGVRLEAYDEVLHAALTQIERVGVALAAIADDGHFLGLDDAQIGVGFVIDFHRRSPW